MQLHDVFPSNYLKAPDLRGRDVTVAIADAKIEKLGDDRKLVIYFQGKGKGLVTNKTNASRIAMLYGDDTDGWIGKEITLYADWVDFQGKTVEAIRIKPPPQREPSQPQYSERKSSGVTTITRERPKNVQPPMGNAPGAPAHGPNDLDDPIPFAPEWR